jgi:hypothetical protein
MAKFEMNRHEASHTNFPEGIKIVVRDIILTTINILMSLEP